MSKLIKPGVVPENTNKIMQKKNPNFLSVVTTERNRWFLVAVLSIGANIGQQIGWHKADARFANNVRVSYVKMFPNGVTEIEIADNEKPPEFFPRTVESKLVEWTTKRYRKKKATIASDYGFAHIFMSEKERVNFMHNYNAPEVIEKLNKCPECGEVDVKVRNLQIVDKDGVPNTRKLQQYSTLAFITEQHSNKEGKLINCKNKIVSILWTFRPIEQVSSRKDELFANPLGQDIISSEIKDDPTPIDLAACKKLNYSIEVN